MEFSGRARGAASRKGDCNHKGEREKDQGVGTEREIREEEEAGSPRNPRRPGACSLFAVNFSS